MVIEMGVVPAVMEFGPPVKETDMNEIAILFNRKGQEHSTDNL